MHWCIVAGVQAEGDRACSRSLALAAGAARLLLRAVCQVCRPGPRALQVNHPEGGVGYEPCAPTAPGAQEMSLQQFADKGLAEKVVPPTITKRDFDKVGQRAGTVGNAVIRCRV